VSGPARALAGVKVVVFGGFAAGPWIGKVMANHGATVIHVESGARPDGFRLQYPPFAGNRRGINRGGCFSYFNDSKHGITLDVKHPEGAALARRLTDWSDLVVENMRPGVMARLGLSYEQLKETNPGLVMISTCNMGQTGPRAHTPGFGSQLSALAGFCGLTGRADGPPMLLYGPYIDFIAALYGTCAALAALERRRRTGVGAYIDISQYECGLGFLAGALLDYHEHDRLAARLGNRDPGAAPHGAYVCADGVWIVLSCPSDAAFVGLAGVLEEPGWVADARFADLAARHEHAEALDERLAARLGRRDADAVVSALQAAGVRAHRVNDMRDLFADPQLVHRRTWRVRRHPEIGEQSYYYPGFELSRTPGEVTSAAPLLGADNERVFREFLGLDEAEYRALSDDGVIG
jgi:crotonobetainyl-CoA:carnitine CoA-transferase CaiB-like acyl-CoA transferase